MNTTRYGGEQPARRILQEQARSITGVARLLGVEPQHLKHVLAGRIRPSVEVRNGLPAILGVPLHELFTKAALAHEPHKKAVVS